MNDTSVCVYTCKCAACLCMCVCGAALRPPKHLEWGGLYANEVIQVQKGSSSSVDIEKQKQAVPDCFRLFTWNLSSIDSIHSPCSSLLLLQAISLPFKILVRHARKQGVHDLGISWSQDLKQCNLQFSMPELIYSPYAWWLASCFLHLLSDRDLGTVKHHGFLCDMLGVKMKTGQPRRLTQWCTMQINVYSKHVP